MKRTLTLAAAALVLVTAAPAGAHVTVNPREATKGSYTKLAFRVPNERPDAGTVKLEVQFPPDHPFRSVNVKPTVGWAASVKKAPLDKPLKNDDGEEVTDYVSQITWQAEEGVRVNPGEFMEFEVSAGPTPEDADQLVFKAVQTYDGKGEVVRWIDEPEAGSDEEPEHPAPVLTLTAAPAGGSGTGSADIEEAVAEAVKDATGGDSGDLEAALAAAEKASDDVDAARAIAIAAGVVAAVAVLLALRRPKPAA